MKRHYVLSGRTLDPTDFAGSVTRSGAFASAIIACLDLRGEEMLTTVDNAGRLVE